MPGSFEKSVKRGTKPKPTAPKSRDVEHILIATHAGEAGVAEIFRALQSRLSDYTWTIVFKGLIIVHLMIREGAPLVTLQYLGRHPSLLGVGSISDAQDQGRNLRHYTQYLLERAKSYAETKTDFVRSGERTGHGPLKDLSVDKGLLRQTESVQHQIAALLKCDILSNEPPNEITLTAFRLLVTDLLALFFVMNEGVINLLEHFFEMSKYDAERALQIYKTFSKQTHRVVEYLSTARQYEMATRLEVPTLKHAPTSLTSSLEEYTHDPDFEINRRQYLAQQDAKKNRFKIKDSSKSTQARPSKNEADKAFPSPKEPQPAPSKPEAKQPAPDLIDFFDSIEQYQQPMPQAYSQQQQQPYAQMQAAPPQFQQAQPQPTGQPLFGFAPGPSGQASQQGMAHDAVTSNSPFGQEQQQQQQQPMPINTNQTGAGFGGYTAQPQGQPNAFVQNPSLSSIPQNNVASFQNGGFQPMQTPGNVAINQMQPQTTNPFRQSMMPSITGPSPAQSEATSPSTTIPLNRQNTNPFARNASNSPFGASTVSPTGQLSTSAPFPTTQQNPLPQQAQPLAYTPTGTNPFARNASPQTQQDTGASRSSPITSNPTGNTNPFRQSAFQQQGNGTGWQHNQGSMGGFEQLSTVPVFPRPGEQQPQLMPDQQQQKFQQQQLQQQQPQQQQQQPPQPWY